MQYLKHYWVRNGEYLTNPGQNGPLQAHPSLPGLEVRYWLTDDNGVDYCLSTVPDHVLINEVDPGLKILTRQEWDEIVATIPEPEPMPIPEQPQEPNWDTFETIVLQSPEMKDFVEMASNKNSLVASAFPAAFYEAKKENYNSFKIVWNEMIKISPIDKNVASSIINVALSCNLPKEFMDIISNGDSNF